MTETDNHLPFNRDQLKRTLNQLEGVFPKIDTVPLDQDVLTSPYLSRLSRLIKMFIPIDAFPQKIKELYHQISHFYHCHIFSMDKRDDGAERGDKLDEKVNVGHEIPEVKEKKNSQCGQPEKGRSAFNYMDLGTFVSNFREEHECNVSRELMQMGRRFNSWEVKEVGALDYSRVKIQKQESKHQNSEFKLAKQKYQKTEGLKNQSVKIFLGKNISLECKEMRHEIMNRAKSNKLLEENLDLTDLEKVAIQINYILNRITVQYFSQFLEELRPYAKHQIYSYLLSEKIIEKVMDEHNFISIYCRLVKRLKNVSVVLGESQLRFKNIFVERLQERFYGLIRKGQWEQKEELYKKQLIGMSLFVGELFNIRFLSKYVFKDCFYELVRSYILQYNKYRGNKSIFYYQTYIECVIKIVEKMNAYYDELLLKKNTNNLQLVLSQLLESPSKEDQNFSHICDYIELLKIINERLPSQRFKITFLLEDFRCSNVMSKEREALNNSEFDIIKSVLCIDIHNSQDVSKIPEMLAGGKPEILMKDFYYQFAEGNLKQVNKHIDLFKIMTQSSGICRAAISSFKDNREGLFIIESDFPFLCEGLAKVLKIVCEKKEMSFQELELGQDDYQDEDVREFLQKIEEKYFKMIMQD